MANPFEKRAIEKVRHDEAFLPSVAPAPFDIYLKPYAEKDVLLDRLVVLSGTPGSGKTTLARLFQVQTLFTLQRMAESSGSVAELRVALAKCGAYKDALPRIAGCRLSMEENYRDCWECPYEEIVRQKLMRTLINARAMLTWLQGFEDAQIDLANVRLVGRRGTSDELASVGGETGLGARARAVEVERAAYRVCAALLPPLVEDLPVELNEPYAPVDLIDHFDVTINDQQCEMVPLLMLDDVHGLHSSQREYLFRWLAGREIAIARWALTRFDAFSPSHVLNNESLSKNMTESQAPGIQLQREITEISLQRPGEDRSKSRTEFRKVAKQMCSRYLAQIPIMQNRGAVQLESMLEERLSGFNQAQMKKAAAMLQRTIKDTSLRADQLTTVTKQVDEYLKGRGVLGEEAVMVSQAMTSILLRRLVKRAPQKTLFDNHEELDLPEEHMVKPNTSVEHGARIHLWHEAEVQYVFGFDDLADIANENAERFLHFAGQFVGLLQTLVIRSKEPRLTTKQQSDSLRSHAKEMIERWNFPESEMVRLLAKGIAEQCVAKSMEPNASLGGGANAFGIPMSEYERISAENSELARVLQFGVAYNVFALLPKHRAKSKDWCLIELSGPLLLSYGLTLQRGGFLERKVADLLKLLCKETRQ
jgi:hypothetical protein